MSDCRDLNSGPLPPQGSALNRTALQPETIYETGYFNGKFGSCQEPGFFFFFPFTPLLFQHPQDAFYPLLKEIFELKDVNNLPIRYNIAWYEQKAVIVLLALLYLGIKNIHLGPTLPAFLSPNVTKVLVENFGIAGIGTVDEDVQLMTS